jgi:hypothetical protein
VEKDAMKKTWFLACMAVGFFTLSGCASMRYHPSQARTDLLQENWLKTITQDPAPWLQNADPWFFSGEPNKTERRVDTAPTSTAMTIMTVKVPDFTKLITNGNFQVQILGNLDHNTVDILGPNNLVRNIAVTVHGNSILIRTIKNSPVSLQNVIVRIGVHVLNVIKNTDATITGRNILTEQFVLDTMNANTLLQGHLGLQKVIHTGRGTTTLIGVSSPHLTMELNGNGNINASGKIGINRIKHYGDGRINIIGADSESLLIAAGGRGTTAVSGYVNLRAITAKDAAKVYLYWVNSVNVAIDASDKAHIGLAGVANNANVTLHGDARFDGEYLQVQNFYLRTFDNSHANITARTKLFAAVQGGSSVYFFGAPAVMAKVVSPYSMLISVGSAPILQPPRNLFHPQKWNSFHDYSYSEKKPALE